MKEETYIAPSTQYGTRDTTGYFCYGKPQSVYIILGLRGIAVS